MTIAAVHNSNFPPRNLRCLTWMTPIKSPQKLAFHTLAMFPLQFPHFLWTLKPDQYICKHRASVVGQSDFWELTLKLYLASQPVLGPPSEDISLKYAHSPHNLYGLSVCCHTFCQWVKKELEVAFCKIAKPNVLHFWTWLTFQLFWCFSGDQVSYFEEKVTFVGDM